MRIFLICILFLFPPFFGIAQKTITYDSAAVTVRKFANGKLSEKKKDPQFQYDRVVESPKSYWDRFWDWFWSLVYRFFSYPVVSAIFGRVIIGLAILVIIFFIIKLTGMTNVGLFGKYNKAEGLTYTTEQENIHLMDFNLEIRKAIEERNYRLAIRLLYLQSLKKLSDQGFISWQPNKTNFAYWQELNGTKYQDSFFELTSRFEYSWYGNRFPTEEEFAGLREIFIDLGRKLNE
jgi:hypothetical protein